VSESYVRVDPGIQAFNPVIGGTRIPTEIIGGLCADGYKPASVIDLYPQLSLDDVMVAIRFEAYFGKRKRRHALRLLLPDWQRA
jgi:uncharacterized protein (DUF433 family)